MTKNPYDILEVKKEASDDEIRLAYRKLAKKYHPDLNPDNKEAETKFKELNSAYDLLKDKEKRAAFDRGDIDMEGHPQYHEHYYKDYAEGPGGTRYYNFNTGGGPEFNPEDIQDIFNSLFGGASGKGNFRSSGTGRQATSDAHYSIEVDFLEAANGAKKRVTMPDGKSLDIIIPAGIDEGQKLRLKGQGSKGINSKTGDAYVEIHIRPHRYFSRKGKDIYIEVPVGIHESATGAKIKVPTISGKVETSIPKGANTGTTLKLKGKGIKGGDQFVKLKLVMPEKVDKELEEYLAKWAERHSYNPRKTMECSL
jgi:DnaJ-class molecular chaperone